MLDGCWQYLQQSWDRAEAELVDIYPNIEHLTIKLNCVTVVHVDTARKQVQLKPEIAQSYKEYSASEVVSVVESDMMHPIEILCDEILHLRGNLSQQFCGEGCALDFTMV